MNKVADTLLAYQFIKRLVMPFNKWKAFEQGVIDDRGKVLIQRNKLKPEQAAVFGKFDVLVLNLKKLLAKLPGGSTRVATIAAAIMLLREKQYDENDVDLLAEELDNHIVFLKIDETIGLDKTPLIKSRRNLLESELKFKRDNPGGEWLKNKIEDASHKYDRHKGLNGAVTGYFTHSLKLPVHHLSKIPGANGEEHYRDDHTSHKHVELAKSVKKSGFDTKNDAILIGINHRGKPHILEGNHRMAHALKHRHKTIHADVRYWNGGEDVKGHGWHPDQVLDLHHHGEHRGIGRVHEMKQLDTRPLIKKFNEDAPAGNVGGGAIAGVGVGPKGEPGMTPPGKKRKLGELPKSNMFARANPAKAPKPITI